MKGIAPLIGVLVLAVISAGFLFVAMNTPVITPDQGQLKKFSSYQELKTYLNESMEMGYYGLTFGGAYMESAAGGPVIAQAITAPGAAPKAAEDSGTWDFSTTNVQVEGVDEADIVKTDGKYVYVVAKGKVYIIDAYPAEVAEIISELEIEGNPSEIYINDGMLVIFTSGYGYYPVPLEAGAMPEIAPRYSMPVSQALIYDVSDPSDPVLYRNLTVEGSYYDSRMIGDYVYVISQKPVQSITDPGIPRVMAEGNPIPGSGDVYYFDVPGYSHQFTTILSFNVRNVEDPESKVFLMSYGQNLYVSMDNIYITYRKEVSPKKMMEDMMEKVIFPNLPPDLALEVSGIWNSDRSYQDRMQEITEIFQEYFQSLGPQEAASFMQKIQKAMEDYYMDMAKEMERSFVHRISISGGEIDYRAGGSVPGNVLNQFSMDEYDSNFRIATTVGHVSRMGEATSFNNVYVLDMDLNIVGQIEDIAPGERIYSARFMRERAYLVTFKKVDPFFVIDLSDPRSPSILGKLKIPGYSDYLHPFDENHIIGIGKETIEAEESQGDFAWYQGVKMAIFDVTDVSDPKELHKVVIGDRGTDSYALHDHKAFLFDREKELLVIPILLAEIDEEQKNQRPGWGVPYGEYKYQGAYVYDLSLGDGFNLKGRITHYDDDQAFLKSGYYYFGDDYSVKRSLYIDNVLYTISGEKIKLNSLEDLSEIKELVF